MKFAQPKNPRQPLKPLLQIQTFTPKPQYIENVPFLPTFPFVPLLPSQFLSVLFLSAPFLR